MLVKTSYWINKDLHKAVKLKAISEDRTITSVIEELLKKYTGAEGKAIEAPNE